MSCKDFNFWHCVLGIYCFYFDFGHLFIDLSVRVCVFFFFCMWSGPAETISFKGTRFIKGRFDFLTLFNETL